MDINHISEKVFLASVRTAKFKVNYDNIKINSEGIFAELDGELDYKSIDDTFDDEKANMEEVADEFSRALLDNKGQVKGMNVDSIDRSKYRIIHNEHKNEIYLFLPADAFKTSEEKESNEKINKDNNRRIIDNMKKWVKSYEITSSGMGINCISDESELFNLDKKSKTKYSFVIERIVQKNKDIIQSNLYLRIVRGSKSIYSKVVRNSFEVKKYGMQVESLHIKGDTTIVGFNNFKTDHDADASNLTKMMKDINDADSKAVEIFKKDLGHY